MTQRPSLQPFLTELFRVGDVHLKNVGEFGVRKASAGTDDAVVC